MSKKLKDTDYLAISTRVRVLETRLLSRERMEQMVEAKEDSEAVRVLSDCGYPEMGALTLPNLETMLTRAQAELMADLGGALGGKDHILPLFQIRQDYQNAKAVIKASALGMKASSLLVPGGRMDPETLTQRYYHGEGDKTPLFRAMEEAKSVLEETADPQRADFILDRACYQELLAQGKASQSDFVAQYVKLLIDAANLRSTVRATRSGMPRLADALIPGGTVPPEKILAAKDIQGALKPFGDTPLKEAAQAGLEVLSGGSMTAFEKTCDNAVTGFMKRAKQVPFGPEPVLGYLFARQSETTAIRIILSGRLAGLSKDTIRERLREAYV